MRHIFLVSYFFLLYICGTNGATESLLLIHKIFQSDMKRLTLILTLSLLCIGRLSAQTVQTAAPADGEPMAQFATNAAPINSSSHFSPQEKVNLLLDKTAYFQGETVCYAASVLSEATDRLPTSRVLYVELLSPDGILLQQQKLRITDGRGHGSFLLANNILIDEQTVNMLYPSGSYQLRAYTRQMVKRGGEEVYRCVLPVYRKTDDDMSSESEASPAAPLFDSAPNDIPAITFNPEGGHLLESAPCQSEEDGLVLDGWVVDKENHPLEGINVTAVIGDEDKQTARKVRMKSDREGYWCLPMDDFYGTCQVSLSLDRKRAARNNFRRIVVRHSLCEELLPSQRTEYGTLHAEGIPSTSKGSRQNTTDFIRYFNVLNEEERRLDLGLPSVSVAELLTEKGLETSVDYHEVSYDANQPISKRFYTEEDYGSIDASIQRLERTDDKRFRRPTASHVVQGTSVNGHPARWNIKVPKDFPSKIYEREINYTWEIDMKYVKSIFLIDYEPTTHPYVEVRVELRSAEEIGINSPTHRTVHFASYTQPTESFASTYLDGSVPGEGTTAARSTGTPR